MTVQKAIDNGIPIVEMQRVVGSRQIAIALDIQLTRLVGSLNLKWNFTDQQIKQTVEDLLDKYPNESLDDFILLFKGIRLGEYGEIIRLDSAVIFECMRQYLDIKYQAIETKLMKEKESIYKVEPETAADADKYIGQLLEILKPDDKKIPPMTEQDIKAEGQEKPKRDYYPSTPRSVILEKYYHTEWVKANFDIYTGKKLPNWQPEEEWVEEFKRKML